MKVAWVLFSLILLVYADEKFEKSSVISVGKLPADSVYKSFVTDYLGSSKQQSSTKKIIKSKTPTKSQGTLVRTSISHVTKKPTKIITTGKKPKSAYDKYDNYLKYQGLYKAEYSRLVGRKGLGFDKRTATPYGLSAPITPELLAVGQKKNNNKNDLYPIF